MIFNDGKATISQDALINLCSAIVHLQEAGDGKGTLEDYEAAKTNMRNEDVKEVMAKLDSMSLLPLRRDGVRYK